MWKEKPRKVLVAICIVTLITVVSTVVFLKYRQSTDQPTGTDKTPVGAAQEVAAEEPVEAAPLSKPADAVTNSIGMKLVYIRAGSFMMGSGDSGERQFMDEFPQHQVRISEGFWMGQTEVTQGQYESVMNAQPWSGESSVQESTNNPATHVSWDEAAEFCTKLSKQEGKTYRLPTEAEWEYACRAGTTTRFSFGDSYSSLGDYAWFDGNAEKVGQDYAHPVGQKKPNPWGMYDMHGNVWEWCSDWYDRDYYSTSPSVDPKGSPTGIGRSLRGGSWNSYEVSLRCSGRSCIVPGHQYSRIVGILLNIVLSRPRLGIHN